MSMGLDEDCGRAGQNVDQILAMRLLQIPPIGPMTHVVALMGKIIPNATAQITWS